MRLLTSTGEGETREYRYGGMETGDAWVGGCSCADKRRTSVEGVLGQEGSTPPKRKTDNMRTM